jgi:hypothetical protein
MGALLATAWHSRRAAAVHGDVPVWATANFIGTLLVIPMIALGAFVRAAPAA